LGLCAEIASSYYTWFSSSCRNANGGSSLPSRLDDRGDTTQRSRLNGRILSDTQPIDIEQKSRHESLKGNIRPILVRWEQRRERHWFSATARTCGERNRLSNEICSRTTIAGDGDITARTQSVCMSFKPTLLTLANFGVESKSGHLHVEWF
jgi:hypothetical protein